MRTATPIAVTVLLLAVVLIALAGPRGRPLVLAGVVLGATAGISATLHARPD